jgi:hypothetical protein
MAPFTTTGPVAGVALVDRGRRYRCAFPVAVCHRGDGWRYRVEITGEIVEDDLTGVPVTALVSARIIDTRGLSLPQRLRVEITAGGRTWAGERVFGHAGRAGTLAQQVFLGLPVELVLAETTTADVDAGRPPEGDVARVAALAPQIAVRIPPGLLVSQGARLLASDLAQRARDTLRDAAARTARAGAPPVSAALRMLGGARLALPRSQAGRQPEPGAARS